MKSGTNPAAHATVAILGWTGQVGGCLYRQLLAKDGIEHLLLLGRRDAKPEPPDPRVQVVVVDYDDMENAAFQVIQGNARIPDPLNQTDVGVTYHEQ